MSYTLLPHDPLLDLDPWQGQRQATFRFDLTDVTGQKLGVVTPLRGASLTHDTSRTIKRQLTLDFGTADTSAINPIRDRITVTMLFPNGQEFPLGRYVFTDSSRQVFTSGKLGSMAMNDEMFTVDQQISSGVNGVFRSCSDVISDVMKKFPNIDVELEASPFFSTQTWAIGSSRGALLESLCITGDYFSPWFGNDRKMHFIRSFDPATKIPDFDFDAGNQVFRSGITETDDLLTAPNKFVVISNLSSDFTIPVVGTASVPPTAPHSLANRGFEILEQQDLQLTSNAQAFAVANNLANRQTIFERVTLSTAPDPRHDSYNVIRWQGELWLELAWSMALQEGGTMNHLLRKAYAA